MSPPESEWVRMGPIASEAESDKKFFWRNKNFRRGIRRGLGGLNKFRGSPPRTRADPQRIGGTSAAEKTEKRPPASATRKVRECRRGLFQNSAIAEQFRQAADLFQHVKG